ncbi:MAG: hypothetical protein U0R17_00370 [Acidimicrobiia bacterium]
MDDVIEKLETVREILRENSISFLNDAVYRGQSESKDLERQCAKVLRAVDKSIHEAKQLNNMVEAAN